MQEPSNELAALLEDLKRLRQRAGYRLSKLGTCSAILNLPAVRDNGGTVEEHVVLAETVILEAVEELSSDDAAVARAMLGLGAAAGPTLTARLRALPGSYQTNLDRMEVVTLELAHQLYKVGHSADSTPLMNSQPVGEHFFYVRDIRRASELFGEGIVGALVDLTGILTRRVKGKAALFLDLTDGTGTIQLMALHRLGEDFWAHAISFQLGAKVKVSGRIVRSEAGELSVELVDLSTHTVGLTAARAGKHADEVLAPTGVYLARLQQHFRQQLVDSAFTEVSTRLISRQWPSTGVFPLKVVYEGYGKPFFLSTSPVPQLVRALIDSPFPRVFSLSRCFTQTYRDPYVSVESVIVSGAATDMEITDVLRLCHRIAIDLYQSGRTAPTTYVGKQVDPVQLTWPPERRRPPVEKPEIQLFALGSTPDNARQTRVGKLCWPFDSTDPFLHSEYVVAEGYSEVGDGRASLTCFTINVERLLAILLTGDIRRIPALAHEVDP